MKRLINKAFLTPSVEQLLKRQIDSWIFASFKSMRIKDAKVGALMLSRRKVILFVIIKKTDFT